VAVHPKYYDQKGNAITVGGVPLQDFSDGDSIRWTPDSDLSSVTEGLDGATTNLINSNAYTIEVDLKGTSISNSILGGIALTQKTGIFLDLPITIIAGDGSIHSFSGGSVQAYAPGSTGGPAVGKRTWKFKCTTSFGDA
jgi:hypothetical protein